MKKLFVILSVMASLLMMVSCAKTLTSEGDSLAKIVDAKEQAVGKTYTLTLEQVNIEGNSDGPYVRLFDKGNKTIFVYVPSKLKNQILNLERSKEYIYQFKIEKFSKYSTLSGKLIDVAGLDGKPISGTLIDPTPRPKMAVLDGKASEGKELTMKLAFGSIDDINNEKQARFQGTTPYRTTVYCKFSEEMKEKVEGLENNKEYNVKFKVDNVDWRIFSTLVSVE